MLAIVVGVVLGDKVGVQASAQRLRCGHRHMATWATGQVISGVEVAMRMAMEEGGNAPPYAVLGAKRRAAAGWDIAAPPVKQQRKADDAPADDGLFAAPHEEYTPSDQGMQEGGPAIGGKEGGAQPAS